jgi:4,5-DOPA dioxygenase extradiol
VLYTLRYPAPGSPRLAQQVAELLKQAGHPASLDDRRRLDHGAWVPPLQLYPGHDVPVVQLSVQMTLGPEQHLRLGEALAPLPASRFDAPPAGGTY